MHPDTQQAVTEIAKFWKHLFASEQGLLQVWTKIPDDNGTIRSNFFNYPDAADAAAQYALEKTKDPGRNVYFCAHLLSAPRRIKENAKDVHALWCELDGADIPNEELKPTCVVESSPGHYHLYYGLDFPIPPDIAENLNRRLAHKIGADPSGYDLTQLLRVPYTHNYKYPDHPAVRLVYRESGFRSAAKLEELLPNIEEPEPEPEPEEGEEPPIALSPEALKVWRGDKPKIKEDGSGEIDTSATLLNIGRVLYDAGANKRVVIEGVRERDQALGYNKYTRRRDADKQYAAIFDELEINGRNPTYSTNKKNVSNDNNDNNDNNSKNSAELPDALAFPLMALPTSIRQFVREGAASIGCAVDFVGLSVLSALSAAIGDSRRVTLKKDWTESTALYAMLVGPPGSKKTPAMNLALSHIRLNQLAHKKEYERQREEYESQLRDYKQAQKDGETERSKPEKPKMKRTWVDDTTVERLADILDENQRGVLVAKDELSGWLAAMNQYKAGGKGSDRQFWLSTHDNSPALVDRKYMEDPQILGRPFASVLGGIQPSVLPDFGKDRIDGLMERFTPVYPDPVASEWSEDEVSDEAHENYAQTLSELYNLEYADGDGGEFPSRVWLTDEAKQLFVGEYNGLVREASMPGFPERLGAAWSKLSGRLARLALIVAMVRIVEIRNQGHSVAEYVEKEDMQSAISLLEYFKNHIRRIYAGLYADNPEDRLAADLYAFLVDCGGAWEGTAAELHAVLDSDHKPEREKELGKLIRAIVKRSPVIKFKELKRTSERRGFRLTL